MPEHSRLIDLSRGWPSPSLLPTAALRKAADRVLGNSVFSTPSLLYGPDAGYEPLREAVAELLSDFYATPWTQPERICITGGASQNLACLLLVYTDPAYTKKIYMVAPTYHLECRVFEDNGFVGRLVAVPEDDEGIDVAYLESCLSQDDIQNGWNDHTPTKRPLSCQKHYKNIIYAVPTFSNPSGRTMTLARRQQLIRLARKHDALVITDDVYDFLHWRSRHPLLPRLVDIDFTLDGGPISPFGNTVSNASFSKILGPGLRNGWAEATTKFIEGLSQCGSSVSGGAPSQLVASIIAETLQVGSLQNHIHQNLIPALKRRSRVTLAAVREFLSPYRVTLESLSSANEKKAMVEGGYFIYLTLPTPLTSRTVVSRAQRDGNVVVAGGDTFEVHGDEQSVPSRGLRICFAWEDEKLLAEGIRHLGKVVVQLLREHSAADSFGNSPRARFSEF